MSLGEMLMKVGAFQLNEPVPELNEPYVLAVLKPWIDVNNAGSLVLDVLQARMGANEMGRLSRPGLFYDYTRYRPTIYLDEGIQGMSVPTTTIHYAKREGKNDILLLRMLEPHANSEYYNGSVLKVLRKFKAKKYILLGSMYDTVPHTRPLIVSGYGMGESALQDIAKAEALPITYSGPSTIANLIAKEAAASGIDASVFIVSLPQYVVIEEDHAGKARLMEVLNMLYDIPVSDEDFEKARQQRSLINERLKGSPELAALLPQLESVYDERMKAAGEHGIAGPGPEMEDIFWKIMDKDIGKA